MLEFRTEFAARPDQIAGVNCQLIVRSELLALPYLQLCERIQDEADGNPALEVEITPPEVRSPVHIAQHCSAPSAGADDWQDPTLRLPAQYTLRDELARLAACETAGDERTIVEYLIQTVDERGWLGATELDAALELRVAESDVRAAIATLQRIAPPGIGARDLRECLLLQLDALDTEPPHVRRMLQCCTEALAPNGWRRVADSLSLTETQVATALEFIREHLTPYPGEAFRTQWDHLLPNNPQATAPDAIITIEGDNIEVTLTTSRTISVRVSDAYRRLDENMRQLHMRSGDDATTQARAQVRMARQLVWSVQQRERSLYAITREIVRTQRDFILHGPLALVPLTHKQIAERTGMHESTISRAVAGKLVMLPGGESVPYSVFFDDALPARTIIGGLIRAEESDAPLTDDQLQSLMAERGFDLARRTVNKYRHALGIPSAARRKAARAVA